MNPQYQNISVEQVKEMVQTKHEDEYVLVDVRQPNEYEKGHIPGAVFIPLGELATRAGELPKGRSLIFYCHSGRRSQAAATIIGSSRSNDQVELCNMVGGIMAWNGIVLSGTPELRGFTGDGSMAELFLQGMELERGAELFYTAIIEKLDEPQLHIPLGTLAKAEEGHARILYNHWSQQKEHIPPFEEIYQGLKGDIVEGNQDISTLLTFFEKDVENPCITALEIALGIECAAFDMYRALAVRFQDSELEQVFLDIAQGEKVHMQIAAEALTLCPNT